MKRLKLLVLSISCAGLSTCVAVQRVGSAIDCNGICSRYADCFSASYDTSACAERCRDSAAKDPDYRHKADRCNDCISARACASAVFSCAGECLSVVP